MLLKEFRSSRTDCYVNLQSCKCAKGKLQEYVEEGLTKFIESLNLYSLEDTRNITVLIIMYSGHFGDIC